jgi:pimeloyl-ACP methyl ester carboxylesterase
MIAELGVTRPDLVERAVLQGPTTDPSGRTVPQQFWRWLIDGRYEPLSEIPLLLKDYRDAGIPRALAATRAMFKDRIEEKLPRLSMPVLVVRGELDPIVPQEWAERATRLLPRGKLVVLPGLAHTVNFSAPRELAKVVREFLEEEPG